MDNIVKFAFSALNPFVTTNKVDSSEKEVSGKDFILWGSDNKYPIFLWELYNSCSALQSVINGTADFIVGDDISCSAPQFTLVVNKDGETLIDLVKKITIDYLIYGGFAIQVVKNLNNKPIEMYHIDFTAIRSDKKNEVFFYSEDWEKSAGRVKYIVYPKWGKDDQNPTSIYYYKGDKTRTTYPIPIYNAAITAIQVQAKIDEFHLNEISNNFLSSKLINFNSGVPEDGMKNQIERSINEKFSGSENAGRIMVSFNDSKDNETTITDLATDNFADRYATLSKRTESQIFTAFRATPNLFGLPTETTGFNEQEYESAFKLYNRTAVRPIQKTICDIFDKITGIKNCITITPYSLENNNEKTVS